MSCGNSSTINQTFILEATNTGDSVSITACTSVYTDLIISCSGNTSLLMSTGVSIFSNDLIIGGGISGDSLDVNIITTSALTSDIINSGSISATTISATTFYGDGSNLTGIVDLNTYTTGTTLVGPIVYFNRNDTLSAYTLNLSGFTSDTYVTAFTYNNQNTFIINDNNGDSFSANFNTITGLTVNGNFIQSVDGKSQLDFGNNAGYIALTSDGQAYVQPYFYLTNPSVFGAQTGILGYSGFTIGIGADNVFLNNYVWGNTVNLGLNHLSSITIDSPNLIISQITTDNTLSQIIVRDSSDGKLYLRNVSTIDNFLPLSGGTVTGATEFTSGLTANTISATTIISDSSLKPKSGVVSGSLFSGNPKTTNVVFNTPYLTSGYTINITGGANRSYTFESITLSGFTINANANTAFVENVHWKCSLIGEEL